MSETERPALDGPERERQEREAPERRRQALPVATEAGAQATAEFAGAVEPSDGATRREVLRRIALGLTAAGAGSWLPAPMSRAHATHVHQETARVRSDGDYEPLAFLPHEWQTLRALAEMIIPADEVSGSAVDAGAPEFIDLLCSGSERLKTIFTSGFLWLDHEMRERSGAPFRDAPEDARHAMLAQLSADLEEKDAGYTSFEIESVEYQRFAHYTTEPENPVAHGLRFWGWTRRLVIDAFYTSPMGVDDVGYVGNKTLRSFDVPPEPLAYVRRRTRGDDAG